MIAFEKLVEKVSDIKLSGDLAVMVNKVEVDSRLVGKDDLFIAISGNSEDGIKYVPDAVSKGAVAVVAEREFVADVRSKGIVGDIRSATAKIAGRYFEYPTRKLDLTGITGTNGKTTTTFLLKSILELSGKPVGLVGTLGYYTAGSKFEAINTTPGPIELERLFATMVQEGVQSAVMEVSSHALAMKRVEELDFDVVAFTNITQDHFDYHKTFENYRDAKAHIFDLAAGNGKWAVLNRDDASFDYLAARTKSEALTYSIADTKADVMLNDVVMRADGSSFTLVMPKGKVSVELKLVGKFNLENSLCAATCAVALGVEPAVIAEGLEKCELVRGRAQRVSVGQPFTVLVDYAHTPDALANILRTGREICKGRLLVLFGCGGDRDTTKRPIMGSIASKNADIIIVTSDNPRTEDPAAIIDDIKPGLDNSKVIVIQPDRRKAIGAALLLCHPDDLLVVAGKGHEDYQILGKQKIHFDDREVIEEFLRETHK